MRVAPATKDATMSADNISVGGKICFFCMFLQGDNIIEKKKSRKFLRSGIFLHYKM